MKRVLAAVADTPYSETVMSQAMEFVQQLSTDLFLLSVIDSDPMKTPSIVGETVQLKALHHRLISKYMAEDKLSKESENTTDANYKYQGPNGRVRIQSRILQGNPLEKICEFAEETDANMIIVGSRGLGSIGKLSLESISEELVRKCPRPVLVVKSPTGDSPDFETTRSQQDISTR